MSRSPREAKVNVTPEMIVLFARGLQLCAEGHDDVDDDSAEHDEFRRIDKRLNWTLLGLPAHCASVFDPEIDGPPPSYLTPSHGMFIDWPLVQSWRRALQAALDGRRGKT